MLSHHIAHPHGRGRPNLPAFRTAPRGRLDPPLVEQVEFGGWVASIAAKHPSKNFMNPAARMRRSRQLQRAGAYHVNFVLAADARMRLVEAGWLGRAGRDDKAAITAAVIECLAQTLGLQNGENEMPIKKAVPGHAQASPARERLQRPVTAKKPSHGLRRAWIRRLHWRPIVSCCAVLSCLPNLWR